MNAGTRHPGSAIERRRLARVLLPALAVLLLGADSAFAIRVKDVCHLQGRRKNRLAGMGLVVGLQGTGDGGKYLPAIQQLQALLSNYGVETSAVDLAGAKNVAIVSVEATTPENGWREGDQIDVQVSSVGAAKSLEGGQLIMTPLRLPVPGADVNFAYAGGTIEVPNLKAKTKGIIRRGAILEVDHFHSYVTPEWQFTLVLEHAHASWSLAGVIQQAINENESEINEIRQVAQAVGPGNVVVTIPDAWRSSPAEFIALALDTEIVLPPAEARIVINRNTQTIVISGEVEVGPAVISHNGLTITTTQPEVEPTPENPRVESRYVASIDVPRKAHARTKLQDLVDAFNQLNVSAGEIIEIVESLDRLGKLTAKVEYME